MYVLIAIRDKVAGTFGPLIQERTRVSAVRAFGDVLVRGGDNIVCTHPEDHDLMELGTFDEQSGLIEVHERPVVVFNGAALLRQLQKPAVREDTGSVVDDESLLNGGLHAVS